MSLKHKIAKFFSRIFYPKFKNEEFMNGTLVKFIFWQKILRINSSTPWPVHFTSKIVCPEKIDNAGGVRAPGYAAGCYLDGRNGIRIGKGTILGPKVSIISMNHQACDYEQYVEDSPVIIKENCWLATGCTILSGVELGEHTIVGAGAVVTHSFPEGNQLIAGNPAKVIKKLPSYNAAGVEDKI